MRKVKNSEVLIHLLLPLGRFSDGKLRMWDRMADAIYKTRSSI